MIKFVPFVEYKMDKCYLTEVECVGLLVRLMADWEDDESCDVLSAIYDGFWTHRFNVDKNQTEYAFGGNDNFHYDFTAIFKFTDDREYVKMYLYIGKVDEDNLIYAHVFDDDEMMGFVDYLTYKDDPKRLTDCDDDWDMK